MKKRFIGIDGESYTVDGEHRYVLLAASNGDYVYEADGLSTVQCFRFLLAQRKRQKNYLFVAFGLNYDVNMILRDLGRSKLETLWRDHKVSWYGYRLEWIPGKWFRVSKDKVGVRIYDVFGFFQKSFVNALKSWNIELSEDLEEMKASRSLFDEGMKDEMITYCIGECEKLVELMDALRDALAAVGLQPSSWVGAGSIASALLRRENVNAYHRHDFEYPPAVTSAILHSYFGGRVELFRQGYFDRLTDYDVASAYPSQALALPSMIGGVWKPAREYDASLRYALWRVRWNIDPDSIVMPFPFRHKRAIFYPSSGTGWYHAPEVLAARKAYGDAIEILDGWYYKPLTDESPFSFIREMYQYRRELKDKKHAGEKVLKLGLNAIYGKLAQGHGFNGKLPPFQSYYWAGRITSGTRARLFDAATLAPEQLVMIATDGIFFDSPAPNIECGSSLGSWERSEFDQVFVAQAGVYYGYIDGEEVRRSRGFFAKEIDFDQLKDGFSTDGPYFQANYASRRFVGLGSALMRTDLSLWRTWHDSERKLSLYPNRKFIRDGDVIAGEPVRHYPASFPENLCSEIYVPKDGSFAWAEEALDFLQGTEQPLKDF